MLGKRLDSLQEMCDTTGVEAKKANEPSNSVCSFSMDCTEIPPQRVAKSGEKTFVELVIKPLDNVPKV